MNICLPSALISDITDFCEKHNVPYKSVDEKFKIEDFFKGVIDKYLTYCLESDERISQYIEDTMERDHSSRYEDGYEDGKGDGYDDGFDDGVEEGKRMAALKEEALAH